MRDAGGSVPIPDYAGAPQRRIGGYPGLGPFAPFLSSVSSSFSFIFILCNLQIKLSFCFAVEASLLLLQIQL